MLGPNELEVRPKDIEGRQYQPVLLELGLDQETSKFVVPPGTLSDVLNYNVTTRGYSRAQGLLYYDGTIDSAINNLWFIGVDDNESTLIGSGFTLGGQATWGDGQSGTIVYYKRVSSGTDYTMLGLVEIVGDVPAAGDTITDAETGTLWILGGVITYPTTELVNARNPGTGAYIARTVTDYLTFINDTVNRNLVSQNNVVAGSPYSTYHGAVPGTGAITGGWQFEDSIYVVRDAYATKFEYGTTEFVPGDEVVVDLDGAATEQVVVARVELTGGDWASGTAAGWAVFSPSTSTSDFRSLASMDKAAGRIRNVGLSSMASMLSGTSPTNGLVWKGTVHGWSWIDTGWMIEYIGGTNAPNVRAAPLFTPDLIDASRAVGPTSVGAGTSVGSSPYVSWTNPGNVTADDGSNATSTLLSGETTQYLKCTIPASILPQTDVKIIGVTVTIRGLYSGANALIDKDIRLVNAAAGADTYMSHNRARREALGSAEAAAVYGGPSDTWGIEELSAEDINNGEVSIWIQYTNSSAGSGTAEIDYVSFDIDYVPNTERVWFYDGSTDVAVGTIHAFQVETGTFADPDNDAAGTMSFMNIDTPTAIGVGMSMYSEPAGAGLFIGTLSSTPQYHLLPSEAEMLERNTKYETILQNYYENDNAEAIYGTTGAGSAFTYDGGSFAFLRTPLARSVDRPDHIAYHDNRLALGFSTGHVVLSSVGVPNDFNAVTSASSWGVGDSVNGLISLPGSVLGVFSESSIRTLEGSGEETGVMRTVSSTAGCRKYTMQNIIGPYFADHRGVSSLETSDKYGDFAMARVTDQIRTWIQDRIQNTTAISTQDTSPVVAIAVRNQNQYRLFFADGYVLVLYFRIDGKVAATFMHYDTENFSTKYVPTFINSSVLSTGKERIVMGTAEGAVWIVDGAEAIYGPDANVYPSCYLVMNPVNFGAPDRVHKHYHVELQGQFYGAQSVDAWADANYIFTQGGPAQHSITLGDYSALPLFVSRNEIDSAYLMMLTDGFSVKLQTTMDGSLSHTFQSILYRVSSKGVDRNRSSKTY